MAHVRTKGQSALMRRVANDGVCPFCEPHLKRYHRPPVLKRTTHWILTSNMYPYEGAKCHLLFISRRHIEHIAQLRPVVWKELGELIAWATKYKKIKGGSFFIRFGESEFTGATISHLHAHIVSGGVRLKRGKHNAPIEVRLAYRV